MLHFFLQNKLLGRLAFTAFLSAFIPHPTLAQLRCDLESAVQSGAKLCLDVEAIGGKTIQVPSNTTRIDYDGLSICSPVLTGPTQPVDVVFAVDISGSMRTNDPTFFAPTATSLSIQQLHDLSPASSAGYLGFANGNCDGTGPKGVKKVLMAPPMALDQGNNLATLRALATSYDTLHYNCGSRNTTGTNYYSALNQSKEYLENPAYHKNAKKAIIFISDGEPTDSGIDNPATNGQRALYDQVYGNVDNPDLPQVFSIFIGRSGGSVLRSLSEKTGGTFTAVGAGDTQALQQAMADIVKAVVAQQALASTIITNSTNGQTAKADAAGHVQDGQGKYDITLDNVVALREGPNAITVQIASLNSVTKKLENKKSANFVLNVAAAASTSKGPVSLASDFAVRCFDPSSITVTNSANQPVQTLLYNNPEIGVNLKTAPSLVGDAAVAVSGARSKDAETLDLPAGNSTAAVKNFSAAIDFALTMGSGTKNNDIVEAQIGDTVTVAWSHPRDPRDAATVKLAVVADFKNAEVTSAIFEDPDGDGIIERIVLTLDPSHPPDIEVIKANPKLLELPKGLTLESIEKGTSPNTLIIHVKENKYTPSGSEKLAIQQSPQQLQDGYLAPGEVLIIDKTAPVVVSATLLPYYPIKGQPVKSDTLRVTFNKNATLVNNAQRPFQLRDKDGTSYEFVLNLLSTEGETLVFEIVGVDGVPLPDDKDSLWIKVGQVADAAGNVQTNPANKRVLLEVKPLPSVKTVQAWSVVTKPDETINYPESWAVVRTSPTMTEQTFSKSTRKVVLVEPQPSSGKVDSVLGLVLEASRPFKAEVMVYSNLGEYLNQIELNFSQEEFLQLEEGSEGGKRRLLLKWDAHTDKGAKVGTGAYIFHARLILREQGKQKAEVERKVIRVGFIRP